MEFDEAQIPMSYKIRINEYFTLTRRDSFTPVAAPAPVKKPKKAVNSEENKDTKEDNKIEEDEIEDAADTESEETASEDDNSDEDFNLELGAK